MFLQVIFIITQNQLVAPEMKVSVHASTLIKLDHIQVRSGSDPDYHPSQWVSDADSVSTLVSTNRRDWIIGRDLTLLADNNFAAASKGYPGDGGWINMGGGKS